jgi:hypothetical protein
MLLEHGGMGGPADAAGSAGNHGHRIGNHRCHNETPAVLTRSTREILASCPVPKKRRPMGRRFHHHRSKAKKPSRTALQGMKALALTGVFRRSTPQLRRKMGYLFVIDGVCPGFIHGKITLGEYTYCGQGGASADKQKYIGKSA